MKYGPALLLSLFLAACGQSASMSQSETGMQTGADDDVRISFLKMANGDPWAQWPEELKESPADEGRTCERVPEKARGQAIALLTKAPAVAIEAREYERLIGSAPPSTADTLFLLRGFSTTNSTARIIVTGRAVTVQSNALGGIFNLRRHPCIAPLESFPSKVYTAAAYDL